MCIDPFPDIGMVMAAENVAWECDVSRQSQDEFAVEPQGRASSEAAHAEGVAPVKVGRRKPITVSEREHPKQGTTIQTLARLRPANNSSVSGGERFRDQRRCSGADAS